MFVNYSSKIGKICQEFIFLKEKFNILKISQNTYSKIKFPVYYYKNILNRWYIEMVFGIQIRIRNNGWIVYYKIDIIKKVKVLYFCYAFSIYN